ncbi:hypothetical protein XENOCAPTIV_023920, partial [Xenoophorus captivus]
LFTNALMAKFNMKGKQGKRSLEKTKVYGAIKGKLMCLQRQVLHKDTCCRASQTCTAKKWRTQSHHSGLIRATCVNIFVLQPIGYLLYH